MELQQIVIGHCLPRKPQSSLGSALGLDHDAVIAAAWNGRDADLLCVKAVAELDHQVAVYPSQAEHVKEPRKSGIVLVLPYAEGTA